MNKIIFYLLFTFISVKGFTQNRTHVDTSTFSQFVNGADVMLVRPKYPAEFPGGKIEWVSYLKEKLNLSIPLKNKAISGAYNVSIQFTVEKEGSLRNIRAESNCGFGMEDEVIRCIKLCPKWKPAQTATHEIVSFPTRQLVVFKIKNKEITIDIR